MFYTTGEGVKKKKKKKQMVSAITAIENNGTKTFLGGKNLIKIITESAAQ